MQIDIKNATKDYFRILLIITFTNKILNFYMFTRLKKIII